MRLTAEQKTFIVERLACFVAPSAVAEECNETFALDLSRQHCERYDPTRRSGSSLSAKLRELFYRVREEFTADVSNIAVAHQSFRLRELGAMYERAARAGKMVLAASLLEQAAKEVGGMYTNRRELSGPGGAELHLGPQVLTTCSDEELEAVASGRLPLSVLRKAREFIQ